MDAPVRLNEDLVNHHGMDVVRLGRGPSLGNVVEPEVASVDDAEGVNGERFLPALRGLALEPVDLALQLPIDGKLEGE